MNSNNDYAERSLIIHQQLRGKIGIHNKMPVSTSDDLSIAYTPGVARPCEVIAKDTEAARSQWRSLQSSVFRFFN